MRHAALLLSVFALVWASAMALRVGARLPWLVSAYLVAQCLFGLLAFWGLQRGDSRAAGKASSNALESQAYLLFFAIGFFLVLILAVVLAVRLALVFRVGAAWLVCASLLFAGMEVTLAYAELRSLYGLRAIPPQLMLALFQGGVLLFAGIVSLSALFHHPLAPELRMSATAVGGFWTSLGVLALAWSIGVAGKNSPAWISLNKFLPAFLAIVAFSWLAWKLGTLQGEGVRQEVPATHRGEATAHV